MTLEVCPGSNVALGVYGTPEEVPLRRIVEAGIPVALGADDPLLFGNRLAAQYAAARDLGFDDAELAALARGVAARAAAPRSGCAPGGPRRRRRVAAGPRSPRDRSPRPTHAPEKWTNGTLRESPRAGTHPPVAGRVCSSPTPAFMLDGR